MLALMIPVLAVSGFFAWMIAVSPIGKAWAERIRHGAVPPGRRSVGAGEDSHEELLGAVEQLRREVAELAERVDFTERLLGQRRAVAGLGPPRP